ncbi:aldehyde dehydrogenase family protein, partial [Halalkalibacterium halodurans]|nr:aldehyde dehydrogenase family protein [Halalkalibacterium halodurans]
MKEKVQMQRRYFHTNETKELSFRMNMLKKLKKALLDYENELLAALKEDLNKSTSEAFLTELGPLYHEITFMLKHLPTW